jgi:hypothetical protein
MLAIGAVVYAAIAYLVCRRLVRTREIRSDQRQALEINDNIVQGLARVKWALEAQRLQDAQKAADETLAEAQKMVTDLLVADSPDGALQAGRLRRDVPAQLAAARAD